MLKGPALAKPVQLCHLACGFFAAAGRSLFTYHAKLAGGLVQMPDVPARETLGKTTVDCSITIARDEMQAQIATSLSSAQVLDGSRFDELSPSVHQNGAAPKSIRSLISSRCRRADAVGQRHLGGHPVFLILSRPIAKR